MKRATTLLAMAAAMTVAMPYQMRAIRRIEKGEPTAGDLERIAKAEAKRARKNAKRRRPKMNFVFLSGDGNPLPGMDASDRRFMVVMDDVEPSNDRNERPEASAACGGSRSIDGLGGKGDGREG